MPEANFQLWKAVEHASVHYSEQVFNCFPAKSVRRTVKYWDVLQNFEDGL